MKIVVIDNSCFKKRRTTQAVQLKITLIIELTEAAYKLRTVVHSITEIPVAINLVKSVIHQKLRIHIIRNHTLERKVKLNETNRSLVNDRNDYVIALDGSSI